VHRLFLRLCVVVIPVIALGCSGEVNEPTTGTYRAVLELPGGEAPFGLHIARESGQFVLYLDNAKERTKVTDVQVVDGELRATFPGNEKNSLRAKLKRKSLEGEVALLQTGGERQTIPFHATLGETHRFFAKTPTDNADFSGRWAVVLTNGDGKTTPAVALFDQQHGQLTGTVMTAAGDHRFLAGEVRDEEAQLSMFAGGPVHLYRLEVTDDGGLAGEYWGLKVHATLVAERNPDAELIDAAATDVQPSQ